MVELVVVVRFDMLVDSPQVSLDITIVSLEIVEFLLEVLPMAESPSGNIE